MKAIDAEVGTVSLATPQGQAVAWSSARWGGDQAEAFVEAEQDLRTGDRIQFTRNNRHAGRLNGYTASVVGIDPQRGGITIEHEDGKHEVLDLSRLLPIGISGPVGSEPSTPPRDAVALYTDSRARLAEALGLRDGAQVGAIDEVRREMEVAIG